MILCHTKGWINQSLSFHTIGKIVWLSISLTNVRERRDKWSSCPMKELFLQLSLRHFQSKSNAICGMMALCLEGHSNQYAAVTLQVQTLRPQWFPHCDPRQPTQPPLKILIVQKQSHFLFSLCWRLAPPALTNHRQLEALVATWAWRSGFRVSLMEGIPPAARTSTMEQRDNNKNRIITCLNITVPSKVWKSVGGHVFNTEALRDVILKNVHFESQEWSFWLHKWKCSVSVFIFKFHIMLVGCVFGSKDNGGAQHGNIFY